MAEVVDPKEIEGIVGIERHDSRHYLRVVSAENKVYILHSKECLTWHSRHGDLLDCVFTKAMENGGVRPKDWDALVDRPVMVRLTAKDHIKPEEPYVYHPRQRKT